MSVEDNPFRWVPALQHMASVKMIEILLRNPEYNKLITYAAADIYFDNNGEGVGVTRPADIIEKVEIRVNELPIPEALKINLKSLLVPMIRTATDWMIRVATTTTQKLRNNYWYDLTGDLVIHLQWNNIGCVDGQKTLESYISTRETIQVVIWNQLCYYCLEDEIIRFAKTIDWDSCERCFTSIFQVYWYHKIHGIFPPEKILDSELLGLIHLYSIIKVDSIELLDKEKMLRNMFTMIPPLMPKFGQSISAIMYFRNHLQNPTDLDELVGDSTFEEVSEEVIIYVLRELKKDTLMKTIPKIFVFSRLLQAPWIMFIDDWMSVFENVELNFFIEFFEMVGDVDEEMVQVVNDDNKTLYEPFAKVWRIYYRKFHSDGDKMGQAFRAIFYRHDLTMLELMFEGMSDNQRKLLLEQAKDHSRNQKLTGVHPKFYSDFPELILKNDEERQLFSEFLIE